MDLYKEIKKKIKTKKVRITIVGLGYVGLPLMNLVAKKFYVNGVDNNKNLLNSLKTKNNNKNITYNSSILSAKNSDVIIFALPTPLKKNNTPDLTILKKATNQDYKFYKNKLVIVESTSYPGTTKELFNKFKKKLKIGQNFFLSYSPERIDPANKQFNVYNIPKIVSGETKKCFELSKEFYSIICKKVIPAKNIETAEFAKIFENIFRSVNIGLVNESKIIASKLNINFRDVLKLASTKPFGFMKFNPGPGVGGHCIPVDPFYLSWLAKKKKFQTRFIKLSGEINQSMPTYIVKTIEKYFKQKKINNPKILLLGMAYKKNVADIRNSPSLNIFYELKKIYKNIFFNDEYVKKIKFKKQTINSKKIILSELNKYDLLVMLADHDYYNKKKILEFSNLIFDTRQTFDENKKVIQV